MGADTLGPSTMGSSPADVSDVVRVKPMELTGINGWLR